MKAIAAFVAVVGASKTCEDYFGDMNQGHNFITVVDPDVGLADASKPYCDAAGVSSPCTFMHQAGFQAPCFNPAPPDGCHRYIRSEYSPRCVMLGFGNWSGQVDILGLFNKDGVFEECSHELLVSKPTVVCYGPPADDPQPCECPQGDVAV